MSVISIRSSIEVIADNSGSFLSLQECENNCEGSDLIIGQWYADVGDFIEWSNEDLFQGRITEEEHAIQVENYNQLILTLKSIKNNYENNSKNRKRKSKKIKKITEKLNFFNDFCYLASKSMVFL